MAHPSRLDALPHGAVRDAIDGSSNLVDAAKKLGVPRQTLADWVKKRCLAPDRQAPSPSSVKPVELETGGDACVLTLRSTTIRTLDDALREGHVDTEVWEIERWVLNKWDMAGKVKEAGKDAAVRLAATELWQVKVWFKRKTPTVRSLENVLRQIEEHGPIVPAYRKIKPNAPGKHRALEIDIFDPHYGLQCFKPAADSGWDLEECEQIVMWAIDSLIELTSGHAPYDEIMFPFGNDFLHSDNIFHTTTQGTGQPESISWHHIYQKGAELAVRMVDRLSEVAPVKVLLVAGNHARQSEFTLAMFLKAYYRNNKNISVDASSSPYKFWRYGVNMIGLEHGHSARSAHLAALMANETRRNGWQEARWCEWHLGDQHRKASAKPSHFEEQGVSVEYLAGLTPANEWHRIKSFNHQKRCANAFIYDKKSGPIARYQVNLDSYTGKPLGMSA
jgi:hypothetical protein